MPEKPCRPPTPGPGWIVCGNHHPAESGVGLRMAVDPLIEPRNGDWKKAYQATRTGRFTRRPVNPRPSHPFAAHPLPGPADAFGIRPRRLPAGLRACPTVPVCRATPCTHSRGTGRRPKYVRYEGLRPAPREHAPDAARPPSGRRRELPDRPYPHAGNPGPRPLDYDGAFRPVVR
ncbi:protein of unknown function [Streptomyces murinus]